jgi:hypothetical protein
VNPSITDLRRQVTAFVPPRSTLFHPVNQRKPNISIAVPPVPPFFLVPLQLKITSQNVG